jgi:L-alanine-DL-glutamate epimerase-like enolase superfamily enzyme
MGDEQGGTYHPESILAHDAVDVERIDVTTYGGITRLRDTIAQIEEHGIPFAPHMFAHVHSQVFSALGHDVPIEWGIPGSGVDQFADSLAQPVVRDGRMEPLPEEPGFGTLYNAPWIARQSVEDDDGLLADLSRKKEIAT